MVLNLAKEECVCVCVCARVCASEPGDLLNRPRFQFHASEFDGGGGGRLKKEEGRGGEGAKRRGRRRKRWRRRVPQDGEMEVTEEGQLQPSPWRT